MYKISGNVMLADLENEMMLLDMSTGIYYGLNETACEIWRLLADNESIEPLIQRIAETSGQTIQVITEDVNSYLNELVEIGILEVGNKS
ncbi:putative PqqD family protein [Paenibacillus sp. 598K]|uniref:PqqD family protein n=1 Tax=Paenibacillus sp. 598K TaxID=1117987 RepID=UPI000FF9F574|nr:PqqD family protein [Paenibacillus sp. 598K]GBF75269.1 putative PqqD family protein [Paenibacillus sp. 598K]